MDITEKQQQKIDEIAEKYGLRLMLLFGSRVDGKINKESDYDVAYLPINHLSYNDEVNINHQLTLIFPQERYRVDTVDMRKAAPLLLFSIFRKCQILFAINNLIFPVYRAYAFKKYIEAKPEYEYRFKKLKNEFKNLKNDI